MKIIINRDLCQSVATCVSSAPDVYELDDQSKATVKGVNPEKQNNIWTYTYTGPNQNQVIEGAKACPFQAITVIDDQGNQIFPPQKSTPESSPSTPQSNPNQTTQQ